MSALRPGDPGTPVPAGQDRAARFLAAAAAWTPAGRGDWARAMLAELDQVTGRTARWRFALGAARAALIPPRSTPRSPRLLAAAAIALAGGACAAGAAIHAAAPGAGILAAVLLPGLPAICAWAVLATTPPGRQVPRATQAIRVIAAAAIAACPVIALQALTRYPAGAAGPGTSGWSAVQDVVLAADLTGWLWLVLRLPAPLPAGRSALFGLAAALAAWGGGLLNGLLGGPGAVTVITVFAVLLAGGVLAARYDGDPTSGLGAALWGVLLSVPAGFILSMNPSGAVSPDARDPVNIALAHAQGATSIQAWVTEDDLGASIFALTVVSFAVGVLILLGAVVARDIRRNPPGTARPSSARPARGA
jgi:hypothetical protein